MAESSDRSRFLKALAFEIHRKRPAEQAMEHCIEQEGRGGRHRLFRQANLVLQSDGFIASLQAAELLGDEAARLLKVIYAAQDHRLLAEAINELAEFQQETATR